MAGDIGIAILGLALVLMLSKKNGITDVTAARATISPFRYRRLIQTMEPETPEEAEVLTREVIRTRRIIVHPTVVDIPTIPTVTQIATAKERVQSLDAKIPTWVKKRWGSAQAVQTPGWTPKGEG